MKCLPSVVAFSLVANAAPAQTVSLGFSAGITRSNQAGLDSSGVPSGVRGLTGRWAPTGGISVMATFGPKLGVQLEANYLLKGYWGRSYYLNLDYLEFPVLAHITPWGHQEVTPVVVAGVAASLKLGCAIDDRRPSIAEIIYPPGHECAGRQTKRWDHGIVIGAGTEIGRGSTRLAFQMRFSRALSNVYGPDAGPASYNQTLSMVAGLKKIL